MGETGVKGAIKYTKTSLFSSEAIFPHSKGILWMYLVLDFSKALDRVQDSRLLDKSEQCGTSCAITRWVWNWLTDHTQHVVLMERHRCGGKHAVGYIKVLSWAQGSSGSLEMTQMGGLKGHSSGCR